MINSLGQYRSLIDKPNLHRWEPYKWFLLFIQKHITQSLPNQQMDSKFCSFYKALVILWVIYWLAHYDIWKYCNLCDTYSLIILNMKRHTANWNRNKNTIQIQIHREANNYKVSLKIQIGLHRIPVTSWGNKIMIGRMQIENTNTIEIELELWQKYKYDYHRNTNTQRSK